MIAIDTNVVVRFLTGDHLEQAIRARELVQKEETFLAVTVLLETEWVLRSIYGYTRLQLAGALRVFAGLPGVTVEDDARVDLALDWLASGMDFADALHLARSGGCVAFATFDRKLARAAEAAGSLQIKRL